MNFSQNAHHIWTTDRLQGSWFHLLCPDRHAMSFRILQSLTGFDLYWCLSIRAYHRGKKSKFEFWGVVFVYIFAIEITFIKTTLAENEFLVPKNACFSLQRIFENIQRKMWPVSIFHFFLCFFDTDWHPAYTFSFFFFLHLHPNHASQRIWFFVYKLISTLQEDFSDHREQRRAHEGLTWIWLSWILTTNYCEAGEAIFTLFWANFGKNKVCEIHAHICMQSSN